MVYTPNSPTWTGSHGHRLTLGTATRLQNMENGIQDAQVTGDYLRRVIHDGTGYPARPAGVAAGLVEYVGPTQPGDWLDGDTWIQTS